MQEIAKEIGVSFKEDISFYLRKKWYDLTNVRFQLHFLEKFVVRRVNQRMKLGFPE